VRAAELRFAEVRRAEERSVEERSVEACPAKVGLDEEYRRKPGVEQPCVEEKSDEGHPPSWPSQGQRYHGAEALALVRAKLGITTPEIAEEMGIKQNYLYRSAP
jgi:hypothetical protein